VDLLTSSAATIEKDATALLAQYCQDHGAPADITLQVLRDIYQSGDILRFKNTAEMNHSSLMSVA